MSVLHRHRSKQERPSVPDVKAIRETVAGPAAAFDWGSPLPPMSMTRIAALPEPEWARPAYSSRHGLPVGWLRTVDMVAVASSRATVEENLTAIAAEFGRLGRHTVAMTLMPVVAELDDTTRSTWDHREIGKPIGRELGEVAL